MKLAGLVIFYNPEISVAKNIESYIKDVDFLLIIDNSSESNISYVKDLINKEEIEYRPLYKNIGLVNALVKGIDFLKNHGFTHILLLDQDTLFDLQTVSLMRDNVCDKYSVICPNMKLVVNKNNKKIILDKAEYSLKNEVVNFCITSGSLIKIADYYEVGGFDTKLFIGQIDQDFCCKLRNSGKKILRVGESFIFQEAGNATERKLLYKKLKVPNYSPIRYFYYFRNERYLRKKYGKKYNSFKVSLWKYFVMVLFFEKEKFKKIWQMIKGFCDGNKMNSQGNQVDAK